MNKRYNVCVKQTYMKDGQEKTTWPRVGTMTATEDGKFYLDIPLFQKLYVFEYKERNDAQAAADKASASDDFNDSVPF